MSTFLPLPLLLLLLLLLLLFSFGLSAVQAGNNSDCGVYGWTVPAPPQGARLVQVHALIRHGDRTPYTSQSCWPDDTSVWNCYLNHAEVPLYADDQYGREIPRVYRKVFKSGGEPLRGNCSIGQLTIIGYKQQVANGQALRKAYVESGFLGSKINSSNIYLRSDNSLRTQQSAESLMLGMYPPVRNGTTTEVVHLITMDQMFDYLTPNAELCPKVAEYLEEFKMSKTWKDHQNITKALLNDIRAAVNFTVNETDLSLFADCLTTHRCHGLQWPKGMTMDLYNRTWAENAWQRYTSFKYPTVQANAQVGIGFLLKEIWEQMNSSVSGKSNPKFFLYSGHDTTLMPILVALQVDDGIWPYYASMMLMELYRVSSGSGYSVRIIYDGRVLKLPFCGSRTLCDYNTFSGYMKTVTPSDPAKQCMTQHAVNKLKWYY